MKKSNDRRGAGRTELGSVVEQTKGAVTGSLDAINMPKSRFGIADD